jgi:hypothetical protein
MIMAIKSLVYSVHKYLLAILMIVLCGLTVSCSNKKPATDLAQSPDKDIQGEGSAIPANWSQLKIEPATGHIGDKVTILGSGLNAEVDLILFGQKIVHPMQPPSPSLSFFVPNLCAKKYNVAIVRQLPNQEPKKSPDLSFEVLGEPCATSNKETANETPSTSETILETVKGLDKAAAQPAPFVVALVATPGYFDDPTALKHQVKVKWQILSGTVDSVTLYNQDLPEQKKDFNDQSLMAKQGEWVFDIDKTTIFIGQFTSGDQVYTETTPVIVLGNENVDNLAPFVKISLKEKILYAKASNQFNPLLEFCWVSNNISGIKFKIPKKTLFNLGSKYTWYTPPESEILKGCYTFHPRVDFKSKDDYYILSEAIINGDTESETIPFKVETDASSIQMTTKPDNNPNHEGYNSIEIYPQNLKNGVLISEHPLLDTNYQMLPNNLPFEDENGMEKYLYTILADDLMTAVKLNFRSQANCQSSCKYDLTSMGWDGEKHELNKTASSQAANLIISEFRLAPSNWTKTNISYEAQNISQIKFYYCSLSDLTHIDNGPIVNDGDLVLDTCSQLIKNNYLIVKYLDYFGEWHSGKYTPSNIPVLPEDELEDKFAALGMDYELTVETLRDTNNNPTQFVIKWKTDWARYVDILVYNPDAYGMPNESYLIESNDMNYTIDSEGHSYSTGQLILPASEDNYIFILKVRNIDEWAFATAPSMGMPPVKIKYWYDSHNYNLSWYQTKVGEDCILGFICSEFYENRCSAPDYRRQMYVEIKNGTKVNTSIPVLVLTSDGQGGTTKTPIWTEHYSKDGIDYVCPGSTTDLSFDKEKLFNRNYLERKWLPNAAEFSNNRTQSWDLIHRYYYDPDILYGCRICTRGREDGQTYCVENPLWDNEPAVHYEPDCANKVQHEDPKYCDANDPWKSCLEQEPDWYQTYADPYLK